MTLCDAVRGPVILFGIKDKEEELDKNGNEHFQEIQQSGSPPARFCNGVAVQVPTSE